MRPFASILALALTLQSTTARVANQQERDASPNPRQGVVNVIKNFFRLQPRQVTCVEDDIYWSVRNYSNAQVFCSRYLGLAPATVVVEYTPTVTDESTYATLTNTVTELVRSTPVVTITTSITTTPAAKVRRNADAADVVHFIRQELADSTTSSYEPAFSQQISSACGCLADVQLSTVTTTYTADPTHVTELVHVNVVQTVNTTAVARVTTTTVTAVVVVSNITSSSSTDAVASLTSTSSAAPTPTSPAFTCPEDDNTTVSQIIEDQRFDFLVSCHTDITGANLASYSYSTFGECAAACARVDNYFASAVCQAVVYYTDSDSGISNCFLKTSGNSTIAAVDSDAAILQQVAVAVTNSTDSVSSAPAFVSSSSPVSLDTSSILSDVFSDSSTSLPLITSAPTVSGRSPNVDMTSYSTFVSDGSTYSTESVYSTYYSANGSWYYSYYTSWTVAWVAATTVVGSAATTTSVSEQESGGIWGFGSGGNGSDASSVQTGSTTITTLTTTYEAGGSEFRNQTIIVDTIYPNGTTSSDSTTETTQTTGGSNGDTDDASGGNEGDSSTTTTITTYNTTTVYNTTSGSSDEGGSGGSSSDTTSSVLVYSTDTSTTYTSTYGMAGSSAFVTGGAGGASSTEASGVRTSSSVVSALATATESVFSTVIYSSGMYSGGSGSQGFGSSGGVGTAASGVITNSANASSPVSSALSGTGFSIVNSTRYSTVIVSSVASFGGTGFFSSGAAGATGTAVSGMLSPTANTSTPEFTGQPRSGSQTIPLAKYSTGIPPGYGAFGASGYAPPGSKTGTAVSGTSTLDTNATSPIGLSSTGLPRSGTASLTSPSGSITPTGNSSAFVPSFTAGGRSGTEAELSCSTVSGSPAASGNFSSVLGPTGTGSETLNAAASSSVGPSESLHAYSSVTKVITISSNTTLLGGTGLSGFTPSYTGQPRSGTESPPGTSDLRTGTDSISSSAIPIFNISSGAYSMPMTTGVSSSMPISIANGSTLVPGSVGTGLYSPSTSGTAPIGTIPSGTGLTGTAPPGTSPLSSASGLRTGTQETTSIGTPIDLASSETPTICYTTGMATTTFWVTTTEFGCYSSCPPVYYGGGGYGGYGGGAPRATPGA